MSDLVNFIRFTETGLLGNIASMAYDIDLTGEEISSANPKAPVYRLLAGTSRRRFMEIGGIWKKANHTGGNYYTLSVNAGYGRLNANLGRLPSQDDDDLMAVIPWDSANLIRPRAGPYLDDDPNCPVGSGLNPQSLRPSSPSLASASALAGKTSRSDFTTVKSRAGDRHR